MTEKRDDEILDQELKNLFDAASLRPDPTRMDRLRENVLARFPEDEPSRFRIFPGAWPTLAGAGAVLAMLAALVFWTIQDADRPGMTPGGFQQVAAAVDDDIALDQMLELLTAFAEDASAEQENETSEEDTLGLDPLYVNGNWETAAGLL